MSALRQSTYEQRQIESRRDLYADRTVTLDCIAAKIIGFHNHFATVTTLNGLLSFQWSWSAVEHIVNEHDGQFYS